MSRPLLLSLLLATATATANLAACGGSRCSPLPPGTRCIKAVAGDACRGSVASTGDNKDCTASLCPAVGGFGWSVGHRCFWLETPPLTELCGGADELCFDESTDACTGAIACSSSFDCTKGLCKTAAFAGYCAGAGLGPDKTFIKGRCMYFDPKP